PYKADRIPHMPSSSWRDLKLGSQVGVGGHEVIAPAKVLPFDPDPLAASFSCLKNCSDGLSQSLSMDSKFFQQPDGGRSHESSASHFNWPDSLLSQCHARS
ncbi:unnamed protein product, partial [Pleuronectes platessa]